MLLKDSLNAVPLRVSGNGSICIIQVFDPCLVAIAEENGKIVGCNHWLLRDIKVSSSSVGSAILSGDLAVHPNHRKRGIGTSLLLFLRSSSLSNARGAVLTYMFANPGLSKR